MTEEIIDGYCTLSAAQDWVKIDRATSPDSLVRAINVVSRSIDEHCGRRFIQVGTEEEPVTRSFVATNSEMVDIDDLVSATSVSVAGTEWSSGAYDLAPVNAPAKVPAEPYTALRAVDTPWPAPTKPGRENIAVTGIWGWPAVPQEVTQACLIQVARLVNRKATPLGLAAGMGEFGGMRVFGQGWDQDAVALLESYRKIPLGFA